MADSTPSDYHLTYLRERWERDRSSRVFLQLAEEYRRRGLLAEALEVLQVGLSHHPGYLAAQVSLGRCWIEAGKPEAAAEVLTGVLAQDPTQAVASRLLIDVWLRLGEVDRTRAAIERCELLGVPPQELQGYRDRLTALSAQQGARARVAVPHEEEVMEVADEPDGEPTGAPVPLPADEAPPADERPPASALPPPPPVPPAAWPRPETPRPAPTGSQVFSLPPLAAPPLELPARPTLRRRLRIAGGDPFQLPMAVPVAPAAGAVFALGLAAVAAPAAASRPIPERFAAPPALEAPAEAVPAAGPAAPFAPVEEEPLAPEAEEALLPEPEPEPVVTAPPAAGAPPPGEIGPVIEEPLAPPPAVEVPWWRPAGAATAPVPPPPAEPLPRAAAPTETPMPAEPPALPATPAGRVDVQPSGALPAPELRPSDPGTATLGELYLRQGHLGEAGKIFHQVLERDPDNEAALRGLESIARRRTAALGASGPATEGEPEVKGLTSRKILLLQKYLHQLRAAAARQPSSESETESGSQRESGSHVPGAAE